jgi:putative oxidoreductase
MLKLLISTSNDPAPTILRLVLGMVIFVHGSQKALGWFGGGGFTATMNGFAQMGIPSLFALLAILAEFLGALGLIVGLLGRVAAFGIACVMVVAIWMVHLPHGFFMNWYGQQKGEGFEYHLLALAMALALMIRGSGALSIDLALTPVSSILDPRTLR